MWQNREPAYCVPGNQGCVSFLSYCIKYTMALLSEVTQPVTTTGSSDLVNFTDFLFLIHFFICAYIVWAISPPIPSTPISTPHPSSLPGRTCSAIFSSFVEEKT
jgi:hypothetical protein